MVELNAEVLERLAPPQHLAPQLPRTMPLLTINGMELRYHPHHSVFKFSVKHNDDGQIYKMHNLTDAFVWWLVCQPAIPPNNLLDLMSHEVLRLELPQEHGEHFIVVHGYLEELDLCGF